MAEKEFIERDSTLLKMWNALYALEDEKEKQNGLDIMRRSDVQAGFEAGQGVVANEPAADVVERKRGKWIEKGGGSCVYCSECGEYFVLDEWAMDDFTNLMNFCPHCGADMREAGNAEL